MVIKVKVSDVAKDFGKSNKEIIELLGDYCDGPAKKRQRSSKKTNSTFCSIN